MNLLFQIYGESRGGYLDYSFSYGEYKGSIGKVYYLKKGGMMLFFNIDPRFHAYGIGQSAFNKAHQELSNHCCIKFIMGCWIKHPDFKHLENGCCTNFNIYKKERAKGLSYHDAALATPTGKWASALGYNKVALIKENSRRVEVHFYRHIIQARFDVSFGVESYLLS